MRHIDAFCHFFPQSLFAKMSATSGGTRDIGKRMQGVRTIHDLDARRKMMDEFDDYRKFSRLGCRRSKRWRRTRTPSSPASPMTAWPSCAPSIRIASPDMWARCRWAHPLRRREGSRAHPASRQRQRPAAPYQRQRRLPRRAALLPGLRSGGEGQAGAAASGAHRQRPRLPGRDQVEIRDLGDPRLALRDQRHGAADLFGRDDAAAEPQD